MAIEPDNTALPAPPPPPGLQAAGTRFWEQLHAEYVFDGSPELTLLVEETARTYDVIARLQEIVDTADTLRTRGSRGQDVAIPELVRPPGVPGAVRRAGEAARTARTR